MEAIPTVSEECGEFSVIRDIPYCTRDYKRERSSQHKFTTDLYLPKAHDAVASTDTGQFQHETSKKPPVVVFVHGGGWRRGDKDLWRHFTSEDINLLVAFIYWSFGLYGNVGKALARRGVPCAVMSYPLSKLKSTWILVETFTSYTCSVIFLGALFGTGAALFFLLQFMLPIGHMLSLPLRFSGSNLLDLLISHLVSSNLIIFAIISIQYRKYPCLRIFVVASLWVVIAVSYPLAIRIGLSHRYAILALFLVSLITSQGILVLSILIGKHSFPVDQLRAVALCVKKIQQICGQLGGIDTKSIVLMGHSAGGHLCAMATLDGTHLKREGIPLSYIKGVVTMSAVLRVDQLNFKGMKQLYLHPSFGNDPLHWKSSSPLYKLRNPNYVPNFLVVTAEQDFHLEEDAGVFMKELKKSEVYSKKVIIPQCNHTSVVCYFERCRKSQQSSLADECVEFIKRSVYTNRYVQ